MEKTMNTKGGMPTTIGVFTILSIVVLSTALFMLATKDKDTVTIIEDVALIEKIYTKEIAFNRYIQDATEHAARSALVTATDDEVKQQFTTAFLAYLASLKENNEYIFPELLFVERQMTNPDLTIANERITLTLNIKLEEKRTHENTPRITLSHFYTKNFSAPLPGEATLT